jgi:tripartite-type tricarboxylate transporter receptor subunit TctC
VFRWLLRAAALAALAVCSATFAQTYPLRPVRIIVGSGPGGPDTTARLLAEQLTAQTGQAFVVDNRPGAGGTIGADVVAKATPDGYTLLVAPLTFAGMPSMYKKLSFDVIKDFTPISHISTTDVSFLAVTPSLPVHNVKELIAYARQAQNSVSYGTPGVGTGAHLRNALFASRAGINMVHVPYKSAGAATTALMTGEVQVMFVTTTVALPLIKSGRIRALAYDNATRAEFLPDIPTMAETGIGGSNRISGWHSLFAPAKTPSAICAKLESEVRKAMAVPEVRDRFVKRGGFTPVGSTSEEFRSTFLSSVEWMREATRVAGIVAE